MAEPLFDKASYGIVRTNPKLTGNVKLVSNGNDLYLESFSANDQLSSSSFKAFKIDGSGTYDHDVFRFFRNGSFPAELAYEAFQEFRDIDVLSQYGGQYEMFYSYGTRSVASESYTEDLGLLAPLWLNEQIPNYFVVFRLNDPSAVNNFNAATANNGESLAQSSQKFTEFVLQNCTAIKTFDLTQTSKLGSYLRRYRLQDSFPKAPLTISWRQDEPITWNGISYFNGGFTSSGSFSYNDLITQDATILQNEYYITQGFQRNGVLLANLINLEFLFSDENADDYSINRYFGLYVNEIEEGSFKISGSGFYGNIEKTQLPKISTIDQVSQFLNTPFEITNERGVLLYLDQSSISTVTGIPTSKRVNEVESIFYVKDKNSQFHTIKKGSLWGDNQLRLFDNKIDISLLTGYDNPNTFATAELVERQGKATAYLNVIGQFPIGSSITFFDGSTQIGQVSANTSLTNGPGTSFESFFNPTGTPAEIASAICKAINAGINPESRFFDATINDSTVYLQSRFGGSRFNRLRFSVSWIAYPELEDSLTTYPITNAVTQSAYFVGGNDIKNGLLKVKAGDQLRFTSGNYVRTKAGYVNISGWVPYLDEPIISGVGTQIGYRGVNDYVIITLDKNQIEISKSGQVALYTDFTPKFGRFSIFPIRDFNFDFYDDTYSRLGELDYEVARYNQGNTPSTGNTGVTGSSINYYGVSDWPDIRDFYNNGGFSNLIGLLKGSDPDINTEIDITSEYQRLEENYLKEQAIASRVVPYINKWCWYTDGTDVRNNPYRLDLNLAFGINNFAPSQWNDGRSPVGFSHEWYYLCEFPSYFTNDAIESSWSYFDEAPTDTDGSTPGTFQRIDKNYFDEYFIADRFVSGSTVNLIDRQLRYGRFSGGNKLNFSEAFLRGVRIIAKKKSSANQKPNFNASKLSYIKDGSFNDYRFSVMLIPNAPNKPKRQIKFIKNEKWKTIVMLIFISFDNACLNPGQRSIDRTSLYSINSAISTLTDCTPTSPLAYDNSVMEGSLSFSASAFSPVIGQYLIQGVPDILGNPTRFIRDITIGAAGQYNSIEFVVDNDTYRIEGISRILSDSQLYASTILKNGSPFSLPSPLPTAGKLKSASYTVVEGGFNGYANTLNGVGFANIINDVNLGNPDIIYETIQEDGTLLLADDGSPAQTFSIELRAQDDILKSIYVGILPDQNKPTIFNLVDIIGYDLSLLEKPNITPIARHSGWYKPLARDIVFFRDPYANIDFSNGYYTGNTGNTGNTGTTSTGNPIPDELYKWKVFNLCRYANTQFYSAHESFGILKNYFYHKVNQEDPSTVLELSSKEAFLSLYPLINEIGIDYKDCYIFSSNWEPGYFVKSIDKTKIQSVIGTASMLEKKSFFGSKYLKVPQQINLQQFYPAEFFPEGITNPGIVNGTFMYNETEPYVQFYLFIQKALTDYLYAYIKPQFEKYVNPKFGFGDTTTLNDDVRNYIELNILGLYKVGKIDFYVRSSREKTGSVYTTAELSDSEKSAAGLNINQNVSTKILNTNPFDSSLIYNKRTGFSESFGFSVTIVKK